MAKLQSGTRIYGNAQIDTTISILGTDAASSNSTGALQVSGGIGVKGNVFSSGDITSLNANLGNLVIANHFTGTLTTANQPNITNVGTLGNLVVTNNANVGNLNVANSILATDLTLTGNITLQGSTNFINVTELVVEDPLIQLGSLPNGAALTTNDGKDRGLFLHYYSGSDSHAFMGWDNSNAEFAFGSNVTQISDVVTYNTFGNVRANVFLGNLSGSANTAGTVTTNAQPNITSVGTLSSLAITGNMQAGNANLGNAAYSNYFVGDGSLLTNLPAGAATLSYVTSNIGNIVAGSTIGIDAVYGNTQYPGGVFTIYQMGPVSLTATDIWAIGGTSKNQYANFLAGTVNTQNINLTLTLANANFAIDSTDTITIGSSTITGSNITGLNITNTGGTYTISSSLLSAGIQTAGSSAVSVNLTTTRGKFSTTGTTLTTVAPVAYTVNSITGSFPSSTVPYWSLNQAFNWSASITGTTSSGNLTFSGGVVSTTSLTSSGGTSGTSTSVDSTSSYIITTSDYTGAGLNGYGTRTIPATVNGTVNAATKYYPIFWKTTASSSIPSFTASDSHNSNNYATGQGANTTSTTSNYTWIATPNNTAHTWAYTFLGSQVGQEPAVSGTQITIESQTYTVYGFTNFSANTFLYTVT